MTFVIRHPDIEGEATIADRALPAYAARGWVLADPPPAPKAARTADPEVKPPAPPRGMKLPARSASAAEWKTYAVVKGMPYEDAMASTRDELADKFAPAPATEPKRPQKNDSTESWRTYAVANGMTPDEAASMGRDEIVAHFTTEES